MRYNFSRASVAELARRNGIVWRGKHRRRRANIYRRASRASTRARKRGNENNAAFLEIDAAHLLHRPFAWR